MSIARLFGWVATALSLAAACSGDDGNGDPGGTAASGASASSSGPASGPGGSSSGGGGSGGSGGTNFGCDPLPPPSGSVIDVTPSDAGVLSSIVLGAASGDTISLADGSYAISASLSFRTDGVTLRGASGDADAVVIDAAYAIAEAVVINASNVTLSDVTITRAIDHPVHVYPRVAGVDVVGTHLYRLRIIDGGEQFVKINPIQGQDGWLDDGRIECSHFELTAAGRPNIETCCGGCYTGGIDAHSAQGWQVRGNTFVNIYCENGGLAEHAVHFWKGARDTLVENNTIVNCARGIGFGLGSGTGDRIYPDSPHGGLNLAHYDGVIRNNVIYADIPWFDTGIELDDTRDPLVVHNTVVSTPAATSFFSSIDYRFPNTQVRIHNNLTERITQRDNAQGTVSNNLEMTPIGYFAMPPIDFHLLPSASMAIDQGMTLMAGEAGVDIDGSSHDAGSAPDLGADELGP